MVLFSKSIQAPPEQQDGIRICIMRKPNFDVPWDIWMPTLAPSPELFKDYQANLVDWPEYVIRFNQDVIINYHHHIELLLDMSRHNNITLLCWELTPEFCHRRLIMEEVQKINPSLETIIH